MPALSVLPSSLVKPRNKVIGLAVASFLLFYLMRQPADMAHMAKQSVPAGFEAITKVFEAVVEFLDNLVSK